VIVGIDAREIQGRPTGTGRYLRSLLRRWTEAPADQYVAYFNGSVPADPVLGQSAILSRSLTQQPVHPLLWQERHLPEAVRRDRVDVFFSPAYTCPLRVRVARVTAVHDLSFFSVPADFSWREALRRRVLTGLSIRASSRVLACSAFTSREIASRFPDAANRLREIALGPDEDLPSGPGRVEARARLRVDGPLLLTVGTLLNRRRLPTLLLATRLLARRFPGLVLDVVGDNLTHPRADLEGLARRLGLQDRVRLSGFVSAHPATKRRRVDRALGARARRRGPSHRRAAPRPMSAPRPGPPPATRPLSDRSTRSAGRPTHRSGAG
jgi:glycosyltransferase involved in cell wall biosynthesis